MRNTQKKKWYEDKSLWKTVAPILFNQKRLGDTAGEVDQIIKLSDIRKGAKVLDLCCGIGRHSLELAQRGFKVVGVDLTEEYLAKARRRAKAEGLNIQFIRSDMSRFCLLDSFDTAINMFTAFGYFENPEDDRHVLTNVYRSLRKGGTLLIDFIGKEVIARIFREREWYEENGVIILQEHKARQDWSWIDNRWIILKNGKQKEIRFGHRIYSAAEITALLKDCGFKSVSIYGDLAGADYDHNAKRLIATAKK
jgi:SAM-dependent methyltransferase